MHLRCLRNLDSWVGGQLDVSYIGRQVYGEIIYLSDNNLAGEI